MELIIKGDDNMKKSVILVVAILLTFVFIPICSNAITTNEGDMQRFLNTYNDIKYNLLYILIAIIAIDSLISIVVIIKKKNNKRQYVNYLILLFEITLLIYFIAVLCIYNIFGKMITYFNLTVLFGYICILLSLVSSIIQMLTIKCDSKIKKRLFRIFAILSIITLVGIIISGNLLVNHVKDENEKWDTIHRNNRMNSGWHAY